MSQLEGLSVTQAAVGTSPIASAKYHSASPFIPWPNAKPDQFPTMVEVERTMIVTAYKRSNRKSVEAAELLGMGKTTFYRKLKETGKRAAWMPDPP